MIAGKASGRSMGYVGSQMLDPAKLELVGRSKSLRRGLDARTSIDTGYRPTGLLQALADAQSREAAEAWLASIKDVPEMGGRILTSQELVAFLPLVKSVGLSFSPD